MSDLPEPGIPEQEKADKKSERIVASDQIFRGQREVHNLVLRL